MKRRKTSSTWYQQNTKCYLFWC